MNEHNRHLTKTKTKINRNQSFNEISRLILFNK